MPILPILDDSGRFRNDAGMIVVATMLHPTDAEQRKACIAAGLQHAFLLAGQAVPPEVAAPVFERGGNPGITKATERRAKDGHIAGETLMYLRQLADHAPAHASLRKAWYLVERSRAIAKDAQERSVRASQAAIEAAWSEARTVAHLWAALLLYHHAEELSLNENLPVLLAAARWFGEFATGHRSPGMGNKSRPVLVSSEIWAIPETPEVPSHAFEVPPLTEIERARLGDYRHDAR